MVFAYPQSNYYFPTGILDHLGLRMLAGKIEQTLKEVEVRVLLQAGFRLSTKEMIAEILESDPLLVGISPTMMSWGVCKTIAEEVKEALPFAHVVMGGHLATFVPREILQNSRADSVVVGYGCDPIVQLAKSVLQKTLPWKVDSLYWRNGSRIIANPVGKCLRELSVLPSMEPIGRLTGNAFLPAATATTSIGCPNNCEFCTTAAMGRLYACPYRQMDVEMVLEQIKRLADAGIEYFLFTDDNLFQSREARARAAAISEGMMQGHIKINFAFMATAIDLTNPANLGLLRLMKRAGAIGVLVGAEAATPESLRYLGKAARVTTSSANIDVSDLLRREELLMLATFININPYSTVQSLEANARALLRMGTATFANLTSALMILPGTETTRKAREAGILLPSYNPLSTPYDYKIFDNRVEPFARALLAMRYWSNPAVGDILGLAMDGLYLSFGLAMRRQGLAELEAPRSREQQLNFNFFMKGLELAQDGWDSEVWKAAVGEYNRIAGSMRLKLREKHGHYLPPFFIRSSIRRKKLYFEPRIEWRIEKMR